MALKQAHVHMADEEVVLRNVKAISEAGPSKLLVSGLPALGCFAFKLIANPIVKSPYNTLCNKHLIQVDTKSNDKAVCTLANCNTSQLCMISSRIVPSVTSTQSHALCINEHFMDKKL